jgi:sec-independent protein translocase protein TatB
MLSIPHLIIIFLVALIVLGPEKLPEVARTLSKAMLEINRVTGSLKDTFQQEMNQLEQELTEKRGADDPTATTPTPASAALEPHPESETQTEPEPVQDASFAGHAPAEEPPPAQAQAGEANASESPSAESQVASAHGPRKPMQPESAPVSTDDPDGSGDTSGKPADGHPSAA